MNRKSFTAATKRLQEVDRIVRKLDPAVRAPAFDLLRGYVVPSADLDVEALVIVVMMEAAKDAERDLRELLEEAQKLNAQKAKLRDLAERLAEESDELADDLRSELGRLADASGELELRLQAAMERMAQLESMLSNLLKKLSETQDEIVRNLK